MSILLSKLHVEDALVEVSPSFVAELSHLAEEDSTSIHVGVDANDATELRLL